MMPASQSAVANTDRTPAKFRDVFGALLALAGEAAILYIGMTSDDALSFTLALHAVVVAGVAIFLFTGRERGRDLSLAATILLLVMVAGPAGAAVALAAALFFAGSGADPDAAGKAPNKILKDWYERLASAGRPAHATQIYDRIASGRVPRLNTPAPLNFLHVIEHGTLDERQKALGLIARQFHPDYTPVLEAALKSPEPVVRVQAAAVVAHVKANLKTRIKRLAIDGKEASGRQALMRISELQALQGCALVDKPEQRVCHDIAHGILERSLVSGTDFTTVATQTDAGADAAMERYLLKAGRYRDLRVLRRVRRIAKRRVLRLRRHRERQAA